MTTSPSRVRCGPIWDVLALALLLLLTVEAGLSSAAGVTPARAGLAISGPVRTGLFLATTVASSILWYFLFFPRMLRKNHPTWPLDAWRQATYGVWLSICIATLIFKGSLMKWLAPLLEGSLKSIVNNVLLNTLIPSFMELILIPLLALVGLVMIWNFRRDTALPLRESEVPERRVGALR